MQRKMYFIFTLIVLISVLSTSFLALNVIETNYINAIHEKLSNEAALIDDLLIVMGDDSLIKTQLLNQTALKIKARLTLIDYKGIVLYDSDEDQKKMENHADREEVLKAFTGTIGISQRYSKTTRHEMYYLAYPSKNKGQTAVIRLAVPLKEINNFRQQVLTNIMVSSGIGMLITILIGYRLLESIFRPIKVLKMTAKKIAEGEYAEKVHIDFGDEMGELAKAFNLMTEELNERILEVNEQNSKMNAILSNMLSVVIAVDREKKIMFMNKEAEELFEVSEIDAKGKHILEVYRNSSMMDQIKDLFITNQPSRAELEIRNEDYKIFNVYANPIYDFNSSKHSMGVVMIFQDITEVRKLENMRKDFVANVSHELKTPLTSIKGFVETLKNGAVDNPAVRDRFLDIIEMESMRLSQLINDLLVLSDIEKRFEGGEKDLIQMNHIIDETVLMLMESARKKNIALITNLEDAMPQLYGNPHWIKQMLINLIDNSIKYTPNDGIVKVTSYIDFGHICIKVEDNGIGIDKEHISRLFERFYRVDKARSRNVGGTGLGLAIVKHIVIAFKGEIKVTSELGKGTQFLVKIPIHSNSFKDFDS